MDAAPGVLSHFRVRFYGCLCTRGDALFELTDAVLCAGGPVTSLAGLTPTAEHRRGHGAMYAALDRGRPEPARLRRLPASTPSPRAADRRIVLAVDVSNWPRPDAATGAGRLFCHVYGRGRSADRTIPSRPYSFVAALRTGRTWFTAVLDAVRLGPAGDAAAAAAQLRETIERITTAGHWAPGDAGILVVMGAGYDATRLADLPADLPVEIVARVRSDRVFARDAGPARSTPRGGRPRRHGRPFALVEPGTWDTPTSHHDRDPCECRKFHPRRRQAFRGLWRLQGTGLCKCVHVGSTFR